MKKIIITKIETPEAIDYLKIECDPEKNGFGGWHKLKGFHIKRVLK